MNFIGGVLYTKNLAFRQLDTQVKVDSARLQLPSRKKGKRLAFSSGTITVNTQLKDISQAFAPVLRNFTMPLSVTTTMMGNENGLTFNNIHVFTTDKQLDIKAKGGISNLKDKYQVRHRKHAHLQPKGT